MFKNNIALGKSLKVSNWRKTASGTWKVTDDSQVYCLQTINVDEAKKFVNESDFTFTHLAGAACAKMIVENPEVNIILRFGKFYPRKDISIFFQVASDSKGKDLSGHVVRNIDQLDLKSIKEDLGSASKRIKSGDDFHYKKVKKQMTFVPGFLTRLLIKIYGGVLFGLNLWSPMIGAPRDAFGTMMITNIGSLGMQRAYVPLVGYSRCPLILAIGKVYERAGVKDGEIVVESVMDCCWTLDHRVLDGVIGSKMAKSFGNYFENLEFKHN